MWSQSSDDVLSAFGAEDAWSSPPAAAARADGGGDGSGERGGGSYRGVCSVEGGGDEVTLHWVAGGCTTGGGADSVGHGFCDAASAAGGAG